MPKKNTLLTFVAIFVVMLSISFIFGSIKNVQFLNKKKIRKIEHVPDENAYLGNILQKHFSNDISVSLPEDAVLPMYIRSKHEEALIRTFGLRGVDIAIFAFPVRVDIKDYNCFLDEHLFKILKASSTLVGKSRRYNYFIQKTPSQEKGIFIYNNNIIIAPLTRGT